MNNLTKIERKKLYKLALHLCGIKFQTNIGIYALLLTTLYLLFCNYMNFDISPIILVPLILVSIMFCIRENKTAEYVKSEYHKLKAEYLSVKNEINIDVFCESVKKSEENKSIQDEYEFKIKTMKKYHLNNK